MMMMSFFLTLSIFILQAASTRAGVDGDGDGDDDDFSSVTLKQTVRENGRVMSTRARESTVRAHPQTWDV